jgi:hypothetical protein
MTDAEKLVEWAIEQAKELAELFELEAVADRLLSVSSDGPDLELGELAHELADVAEGAVQWFGELVDGARRQRDGLAGGAVRWLLPLGVGVAAMAAAKNRRVIARWLPQLLDQLRTQAEHCE